MTHELRRELVVQLQAARAEERDQSLFYRALAGEAEQHGARDLSERLNGLHADEQHHVSRLSARLLELGEALEELPPPSLPEVALEEWEPLAREREQIEVDRYQALLAHGGLDEQTRRMLEEFLVAERHHEQALGGKWMGA
jgi:rubrerythrin